MPSNGCATNMYCAMFEVPVNPVKSLSGMSKLTHSPCAGFAILISCSESSPPPNALSAPKSTSYVKRCVI